MGIEGTFIRTTLYVAKVYGSVANSRAPTNKYFRTGKLVETIK